MRFVFRRYERILLIPAFAGVALIGLWFSARIYGVVASRGAIARFRAERASENRGTTAVSASESAAKVDFHLWSPQRISAYRVSLTTKKDAPIAVLRIPKIQLEVPVFDGTDDLTLDRGVGRVFGTAKIGQAGNLGIAGHRDGFFRGLQDVAQGDRIELILPEHNDRYTVEQTQIVLPDDISVLTQTANRTLTLITCYPFYFVGHAPKRYIVSAVLESSERASWNGDGEANYGYERSTDKYKEKQK